MRKLVGSAVAIFILSFALTVGAQEMKLHLAHWNVPKDPNTKVLETIAKDMEEASGGKIKSEISWQALGKPGDYYDALINNLADIACFGPTYSPGRFPITEMMTLPIHYPDNKTVVKAYYQLWKKGYLNAEFKKFHTIAVGNNSPFHFMWGKNPITGLESFKNRKVAAPYQLATQLVQKSGAVPVGLPVGEVYSALDTGVIEGTFQIYPSVPIFRLHEVVKYVTETSMSCGPYIIAVNVQVWNKLPDRVKKVLDEKQEIYSTMMAEGFQGMNDLGKKMFLEAGGKVNNISADDTLKLDEACKPIFKSWLEDAKKREPNADKALDDLYAILVSLGVEKPFAR